MKKLIIIVLVSTFVFGMVGMAHAALIRRSCIVDVQFVTIQHNRMDQFNYYIKVVKCGSATVIT